MNYNKIKQKQKYTLQTRITTDDIMQDIIPAAGRIRTVVSIMHCGCIDLGWKLAYHNITILWIMEWKRKPFLCGLPCFPC